jgi:hypothetical protein
MPLLSAGDDLRKRTLARLSGSLARLRYLADLRAQGHAHWGLEQKYGSQQAAAAIRKEHTEGFIEVLRTDLDELVDEFPKQEEDVVTSDGAVPSGKSLEPENAAGGSRHHLSGLLYALAKVQAWRKKRDRGQGQGA